MTFGFIVDISGNGNYTNITSALSAATAGVTISVRPGIYEEDLPLKDKVNIVACTGDSISGNTIIKGMCSLISGVATISNILLETNGNYAISVTGTDKCTLNLENCYLKSTASNASINFSNSNSNSSVNIRNCQGDILGNGCYWIGTSPGILNVQSSFLFNSSCSTTPNYCTQTHVDIISSGLCSVIAFNGSGNLAIGNTDLNCLLTNTNAISLTGTSSATLTNIYVSSGIATAIIINTGCFVAAMGVNVFSTNFYAICGGGALLYNNLSFPVSANVAVTNMGRMGYLG